MGSPTAQVAQQFSGSSTSSRYALAAPSHFGTVMVLQPFLVLMQRKTGRGHAPDQHRTSVAPPGHWLDAFAFGYWIRVLAAVVRLYDEYPRKNHSVRRCAWCVAVRTAQLA